MHGDPAMTSVHVLTLDEVDLTGKRVFIRSDLNVPLKDGQIVDDTRIRASLPAILRGLESGAAVMVTSHLGRPEEGSFAAEYSLAPVAVRMGELLGREVPLVRDWVDGVRVQPGDLVLLENCRFNQGEKKDDDALARKLAALCDVYVMDAFGSAHRAQATTYGIARYAPVACAGPLLAAELAALGKALEQPERPLVAIVGGSKVSTKLMVLETLLDRVDQLIVGGGIANTFIAAAGYSVGKSLYEADLVDTAKRLLAKARERGAEIPVPTDVVCAVRFAADAEPVPRTVDAVGAEELILDIGPETAARCANMLKGAGSIVWNGPVGVFEFDAFGRGTEVLARAIGESGAFSLAGGGDTLAAIAKYGISSQISYISTGGGAFLEFLEGKTLPAVAILQERAA